MINVVLNNKSGVSVENNIKRVVSVENLFEICKNNKCNLDRNHGVPTEKTNKIRKRLQNKLKNRSSAKISDVYCPVIILANSTQF